MQLPTQKGKSPLFGSSLCVSRQTGFDGASVELVQSCLFSGERPYLVSGSDDCTVRVWDYQTKQCIQASHLANPFRNEVAEIYPSYTRLLALILVLTLDVRLSSRCSRATPVMSVQSSLPASAATPCQFCSQPVSKFRDGEMASSFAFCEVCGASTAFCRLTNSVYRRRWAVDGVARPHLPTRGDARLGAGKGVDSFHPRLSCRRSRNWKWGSPGRSRAGSRR